MHTLNVETVLFTTKINGEEVQVDFSKMHPSWVEAHLQKAAQRFLNDRYSGEKGATKLKAIRADLAVIHSGEPMPVRERQTRAPADPVEALAVKTAKGDLLAKMKSMTGANKIADILAANNPTVNKYFTPEGVWIESAVIAFIEKQAANGKRAYVEEARAILDTDI